MTFNGESVEGVIGKPNVPVAEYEQPHHYKNTLNDCVLNSNATYEIYI